MTEEIYQDPKPQNMTEKLLSAKAGHFVKAGDTISAKVDRVMATDGSGPLAIRFFNDMGGKSSFDAEKVLMIVDHYVPCPNAKVASLHTMMHDFCAQGYGTMFDGGQGICHQLLPERGHVVPGSLIVGGDSHSTTYGALNALGTGVGSSDLAAAIIKGELWLKVPEAVAIHLNGQLRPHVEAKDLALTLVGLLGSEQGNYRSIEFMGSGITSLSIAQRMTLCNLMVETGAKCALMPADEATWAYVRTARLRGGNCDDVDMSSAVYPDEDANYIHHLHINLEDIVPMVAKPHTVDNVASVTDCGEIPIHMAVLGTCTNGRIEDIRRAVDVIGDRPLAAGVQMLVIPASQDIYIQASQEGLLARLAFKGALILPAGCGPCCGSSPGIPRDGWNVVSTANRNFIGRMGNVRSSIYLASPATVAASAVDGVLCCADEDA